MGSLCYLEPFNYIVCHLAGETHGTAQPVALFSVESFLKTPFLTSINFLELSRFPLMHGKILIGLPT